MIYMEFIQVTKVPIVTVPSSMQAGCRFKIDLQKNHLLQLFDKWRLQGFRSLTSIKREK